MTFPERLSDLINEKRINKNQLQKELNLNKSSILNWTTRGNIPSGDTLALLAKYFNVSVDYLLGASDIRTIKKAAVGDDSGLGKLDYEIIDAFQQLTSEQQKQALAYLAFLKLQQ